MERGAREVVEVTAGLEARNRVICLFSLCFVAGAGSACLIAAEVAYVLDPFETASWGVRWGTVALSPKVSPQMTLVASPVHSGKGAAKVIVPPGERLVLVTQHTKTFVNNGEKPFLQLLGRPTAMRLWVFGQKGGQKLVLSVYDKDRKEIELPRATVNFDGWQEIRFPIPDLPLPVQFGTLAIIGGERGEALVLDDLAVETVLDKPTLYLDAQLADPLKELVEGQSFTVHLTGQSLAAPRRGVVHWRLVETGGETRRIREEGDVKFDLPAGGCLYRTLSFRPPAGVYEVEFAADDAGATAEAHLFPKRDRAKRADAVRLVKSFLRGGSTTVVFQNDLVPYLMLHSKERELVLFNGLPMGGLQMFGRFPEGCWLIAWFSGVKAFRGMTLSNGAKLADFDVPLLVSFQHKPTAQAITSDGFRLTFEKECGYVWMMPLYGLRRYPLSESEKWPGKRRPPGLEDAIEKSRFWMRAMRAVPVSAREDYTIDALADAVTITESFDYLTIEDDWGTRPLFAAPVQPIVSLARDAGMKIEFSDEPADLGCLTSVGPYRLVKDKRSYSFTLRGFLKYINETRLDEQEYAGGVAVNLERNYRWTCHEAYQILHLGRLSPRLAPDGRAYAQNGIRCLVAFMLNPENLRFTYDRQKSRLYVHDGMNWERMERLDSNAVAAEHVRAFYYAADYGAMSDLVKAHWRHIQALDNVYSDSTCWATSAFNAGGGDAFDSVFNGHISMARMASIVGDKDAYARACYMAAKKFIAAVAMVKGAPEYLRQFDPPVGAALRPNESKDPAATYWTDICGGTFGFMPSNHPITHRPDEAEYHFAYDHLRDSLARPKFNPGPHDFLGKSPDDWARWKWLDKFTLPIVDARPRPGIDLTGSQGGNYMIDISFAPYYPPRIEWKAFKLASGEPLNFGYLTPGPQRLPIQRTSAAINWVLSLTGCHWTEPLGDLTTFRSLPSQLQALVIENARDRIGECTVLFEQQAAQDWLVCGPFPMDSCDRFDEAHPPEKAVDLEATYPTTLAGKSYTARWKRAAVRDYKLDFNALYEPNLEDGGNGSVHCAVAYALVYIKSPDERRVKLCVGSDDAIRIWLNDSLLHSHHVHRLAALDQDIVGALLRPGWNKLLVKVENRTGDRGWELLFRIADEKLLPFADIQLATQPGNGTPPR